MSLLLSKFTSITLQLSSRCSHLIYPKSVLTQYIRLGVSYFLRMAYPVALSSWNSNQKLPCVFRMKTTGSWTRFRCLSMIQQQEAVWTIRFYYFNAYFTRMSLICKFFSDFTLFFLLIPEPIALSAYSFVLQTGIPESYLQSFR